MHLIQLELETLRKLKRSKMSSGGAAKVKGEMKPIFLPGEVIDLTWIKSSMSYYKAKWVSILSSFMPMLNISFHTDIHTIVYFCHYTDIGHSWVKDAQYYIVFVSNLGFYTRLYYPNTICRTLVRKMYVPLWSLAHRHASVLERERRNRISLGLYALCFPRVIYYTPLKARKWTM